MASVKWLRRIVVTARPFQSYFQTFEYSLWDNLNGLPSLAPVRQGAVKAGIAFPAQGETIARNSRYRIHGAAWAGESMIWVVEVSTDGGDAWHAAKFLDSPQRYRWTRWEYEWRVPARARAYSTDGESARRRGTRPGMGRC